MNVKQQLKKNKIYKFSIEISNFLIQENTPNFLISSIDSYNPQQLIKL